MTTENKRILIGGGIAVAIIAIVIVMIVVSRNRKNTGQPFQSSQIQISLATPTEFQIPTVTPAAVSTTVITTIPSTGWKFEGFNGEKTVMGKYKYEWANFVNDNSMKLKGMCSAPNSPAPKIGDEYYWDKNINILIPVVNNKYGDIQTFWYPTIQP